MRSIRTFAYAAALALSMFTIQPTLVAAEDAHGGFTLAHEVHWQNSLLPAGDYSFAIQTMGTAEFLILRGINGTSADAMLLVNNVESAKPNEVSRLVMVSRDGQSFVSSMELPEHSRTLRFAVPSEVASK